MDKKTIDKINQFTRRPLTEKELYVFPVILCDNEIDRDGERFSDKALEQLSKLFIGRTGIFDHDPTASNQSARIFDTEIVSDPARITRAGEAYKCLKASAYMVRTTENETLIAEIDAGIKKEVSISCSTLSRKCSICGADRKDGPCGHEKYKEYDGKMCHTVLDDITDAYEWSFVAVPAQINAGVTKKYKSKKEEKSMENEFTPITTQEALDEAVNSAVSAAVAEAEKKYEGWKSPDDFAKIIKERDDVSAKNKQLQLSALKMKLASDNGIPLQLAERLSGETEEEITKDAELFAQLTKSAHQPRHFSPEGGDSLSGVEREFYAKNPELRGNN